MSTHLTTLMFVSLDPDPEVESAVRRYKQQVRQLTGDQQFLSDPPHITAYLAHFESAAQVIDAVGRLADELAAAPLSIVGWHVFSADQLTGNHTLVLEFDESTQSRLRTVQHSLLGELTPLHDSAASRERYAPRLGKLSDEQHRSIAQFGFPFTGEGWHPHLTVASIRPEDWHAVEGAMLNDTPQFVGDIRQLTVYRLLGSKPVVAATFPLRCCEVPT